MSGKQLYLTLLILSAASVSGQLLQDGKFCNVNEDCISNCCIDKRCQINNNCKALKAMDDFVKGNYCDINVHCASKCCLFGECVEYDQCFQRYDLPIILGLACGIGLAFLLMLLAYLFTPKKRQAPAPAPQKQIEEEIIQDDLGGPIYYEGDQNPPMTPPMVEDLQPMPIQQEELFEDNVEVGYYDEKMQVFSRDYQRSTPNDHNQNTSNLDSSQYATQQDQPLMR